MQREVKSHPKKVCYLCGLPLEGKESKDHVPPNQLYAKEIKKNNVHSKRTRQRFSAAHELGHWMYDRGKVAFACSKTVLNSEWRHCSKGYGVFGA